MWATALILMLTDGTASAQTPEAAQSQPIESVKDYAKIPVDQKQADIEKMLASQRSDLAKVSQLVSNVRSERDMVRLNCVDQKRAVIQGLLRVSEQASLQFQTAIAEGGDSNAPYARIVLASQRSSEMTAQAMACVGTAAVYTGITEVELVVDEGVGAPDPTQTQPPPPPAANVPPAASTF